MTTAGAPVPHVVAWNLTRRCNLACSHCYISAGSWHGGEGELDTAACRRILDDVLEVNPAPLLILSGGEPLVRDDLEELAAHASDAGATVVVGTNGIGLTDARIDSLREAGVQGVAVSVDSLRPEYHDRFRHGGGALRDTLAAVDRLVEHELDLVIQSTLTRGNRHEVNELAAWAAGRGAVSFNLYFLVPTGRGERMDGLAPGENEAVLEEMVALERRYRGRMMIRSKCQPQLMRHIFQADDASPLLNYRTRCPCGVHYCRITPEGKLTPCPYLPAVAGDLTRESFRQVWEKAPLFQQLRHGELGGRCGRCEYREVCGGCRARAWAQSGDLLGPDDSCAWEPTGDRPVVRPRGEVFYGDRAEPELAWTDGARARLERIPSFVRGVVTSRVESFARERGYAAVDLEVMAEVRRALPVDFSKRLPFFLRGDAPPDDPGAGEAHDA
ncbi:MAG: radical SAM protein [Longimicrobiales bacterium]|nr:radical SAM protein [Longimicrobiales bacterium]